MFTKDNIINTMIYFCFKMMLCEKGKFPYSFSILLTQRRGSPVPKLKHFYHLSHLERDVFKE